MADLTGQSLGRYNLVERLGEGGMATVYKAYDTRLEREVAIKIIRSAAFPPEYLDQVLKRFEREAKALARLSHPNIVKVHDYGEHEGSPYLVMEYLPGGTLKKFLSKPIPWQEAFDLFIPVARGVAYAHQRGILHRDIKPANILITEGGEPMLSDFGIAKLFEVEERTTLTGTGTVIGTPEYMSPEQWNGKTSPRSDQYSLGIVLYEMVVGHKPYIADTPAAIMIKQATEPISSPRKFIADLPEALEFALIKALSRDPEDRYKDLDRFIDALKSILLNAPATPSEIRQIEETAISSRETAIPTVQNASLHDHKATQAVNVGQSTGEKNIGRKTSEKTIYKRGMSWKSYSATMIVLIALMAAAISLYRSLLKEVNLPTLSPTHDVVSSTLTQKSVFIGAIQTTAITQSSPGLTPTQTIEPSPAATATLLPLEITDTKNIRMHLVSAGEFSMGYSADSATDICYRFQSNLPWSNPCRKEDYLREEPIHKVFLDNFYMDVYEVSNEDYKKCVSERVCDPPLSDIANRYSNYYPNENFQNYPVVNVTWGMAKTYCEWRGGRLPTEAEWEKAARGTDGRTHPWGSFNASYELYNPAFYTDKANINLRNMDKPTMSVDSNRKGLSPYGLYNMAGNVAEWVADWYSETYYGMSPVGNPLGPSTGDNKVIRGGSVNTNEIRTSARDYMDPTQYNVSTGFRCAKDAMP